jgi:nucleoside-diphosphate-sugar epimerase
VYEMAKLILEKQYIPIIGQGKSRWNNVHVADLSDVFLLLVEKAVAGDTSEELWGPKGYIFTENGEHIWSDLARHIGKEAEKLGLAKDLKDDSLDKDEALKQAGFEAVSWGLNSRGKAERARKFLGWKPSRPSLEDQAATILEEEHERLSKA